MNKKILITGGCRSGKSSHALHLADHLVDHISKQAGGVNKLFIATCIPGDDEMKERVASHQKERGSDWKTIESPYELAATIEDKSTDTDILLVDCLTLWVSNLLLKNDPHETLIKQCQEVIQSVQKSRCPVILVTNEVGTGVVPENRLARRFRDSAGYINQRVAAVCDKVIWMISGIPLSVKK